MVPFYDSIDYNREKQTWLTVWTWIIYILKTGQTQKTDINPTLRLQTLFINKNL